VSAVETAAPLPYRILSTESSGMAWLGKRKLGVGASESPAILGLTAWGSPLTVWNDKTSDEVVDIGNDLMEFGTLAEPLIEQFMLNHPERFRFMGEIHPAEGLLQSIKWPWLLGTLDARVLTPGGFYVPLEKKSINDHAAREWRPDFDITEPDAFGTTADRGSQYVVPPKYQIQVQQQMAVTDAPFAYVAAWLGKDRLEVIRVDRDDEFIQKMLVDIVGRFWTENVLGGVAPDPVFGDDLWELFPGNRGEVIEANESILDDVFIWRRAGVDKRDAEEDYKQRGFKIATFMGNATELVHPVTKEVLHTLRSQNGRRTADMDKLQTEFPEAYKACLRQGDPYRVHRATKAQIELDEG
jgi:predicted phage-related endonuclease